MNYEDIFRTSVIYETPFESEIGKVVSDMKKQKEEIIIRCFQEIGVNPDVVIEQQKEINRLREYIEEHIKWHIIADGDLPKEKGDYIIQFDNGNVYCGYYAGEYWESEDAIYFGEVVAWMPLPEPLKKDEVE